jgi:hypothetical protein
MKIELSELTDWDSKDVALRDFLNKHRRGPWTEVVVTLADGRSMACRNPQLVTMVHPEATEIRVFATSDPSGWCPLDRIESLEIGS